MLLTALPCWYRARLRQQHHIIVESHIDNARTALAELGQSSPASWNSIRASYERPCRSVRQSFTVALSEGLGAAAMAAACCAFLAFIYLMTKHGQTATGTSKPWSRQQKVHLIAIVSSAIALTTAFTVSLFALRRHGELRAGDPPRPADRLVTEALKLLPACRSVALVAPGRERTTALDAVNTQADKLNRQLLASARARGGVAAFRGDDAQLRSHARKVKAAVNEQLSRMLVDHNEGARALADHALHIATAQAESRYGALLLPEALPSDPGPDALSGRALLRVLSASGGAAVSSLPVLMRLGVSGSALLFIPMTVFALTAVIVAAATGNLHSLGPLLRTVRGESTAPSDSSQQPN